MGNRTGNQRLLFKLLGILSVIRGYNLLIIILAQYLTSIFILSTQSSLLEILTEKKLFTLVLATVLSIASGYIINSFYDGEKDLINRPEKTKLDHLVSQQTKLNMYFVLNFLAVIVASYNSFQAVMFFSFYIFAIWLYSHKVKRRAIWGNITATALAIFPFFAIFLYFENYQWVIFGHAVFLTLIILLREIVKDLENISGDVLLGYETIPVKYGIKSTKFVLVGLIVLTISVTMVLVTRFTLGKMYYYFNFSIGMLLLFGLLLMRSKKKKHFLQLHLLLKFLITIGVFSIVLIDA